MSSKMVHLDEIDEKFKRYRDNNKQIVFTNGCFDIIHAGHVRYLTAARSEGDVLVIGLNSDESIKLIKGDKRPIIPMDQRAEILSGFWFVDHIVDFSEPDPLNLIKTVKPDILVKGEDWSEENIVGADFVKNRGGRVVRISFVPGVSTSDIIQKIVEIYG